MPCEGEGYAHDALAVLVGIALDQSVADRAVDQAAVMPEHEIVRDLANRRPSRGSGRPRIVSGS